MARPYRIPDPNDRSPNEPSIIVSSDRVVGTYNRFNPDDKMQNVTSKVQEWYTTKAINDYHWDYAKFSGNQCILEVTLEKRPIPEE